MENFITIVEERNLGENARFIAQFCEDVLHFYYIGKELSSCHGWNHSIQVLKRFLDFTKDEEFKDYRIAGILAAATHDISLFMGSERKYHEVDSADWILNNLLWELSNYHKIERILYLEDIMKCYNFTKYHRSSLDLSELENKFKDPKYLEAIKRFNDADTFCTIDPLEKIDRFLNHERMQGTDDEIVKEVYFAMSEKYSRTGYSEPRSKYVKNLIATKELDLNPMWDFIDNVPLFNEAIKERIKIRRGLKNA